MPRFMRLLAFVLLYECRAKPWPERLTKAVLLKLRFRRDPRHIANIEGAPKRAFCFRLLPKRN